VNFSTPTFAKCTKDGAPGPLHLAIINGMVENALREPGDADFIERHPEGEYEIELLFYQLPNGHFKLGGHIVNAHQSKIGFGILGDFPTREAARAGGLRAGRERIQRGFEI